MIYLDNAATSWPKPQSVLDAMIKFQVDQGGSPNRAGHSKAAAADRIVRETRAKLARIFNVDDPSHVIHCFNCTDALNVAIKGCLRAGDHVITTVLEHNSVSRPLQAMADASFITLTRLDMTGQGLVDPGAIRAAITPKTRLITTIHASNVTGAIQPVAAIGEIARENDCLFLVDAAQSVGVLDVDVQAMHIDLLAYGGHKSLLGPTGTGGLCVGPRATLRPWREGGTGWDSAHPTQPTEFPTWLEAGTPNTIGLAGLSAALDSNNPHDALAHKRSLLEQFVSAVADDRKIKVVGDIPVARSVGVASFLIEGVPVADAAARLDREFSIYVRPGLHCAPYIHRALGTFPEGTVRISPGVTTTHEEIDQLVAALQTISR